MNLKNQFGRQIQYTTALIVGFVIIFMLTLTLAQSPKILAQSAPQGTIPTIIPTEPPTATPASARLTIRKDAVPNDSQNFLYYGPFGLEINLDDASPDDGDSFTDTFSIVVPPGSYSFSEAILANWDLTAINCTPSTGVVVDLLNTSVSITANGGDDISCVFVNSQIVTPSG